ncbi:MAG: GNAT family N-acetyltransferase [Telluria sp.]
MSWSLVPAAQYDAHAARWQALNAATLNTPLLEPGFVAPLLAHFADGRELLAIYTEGAVTVAMAIVQPTRSGVWETFQPSQAPIGAWLQRAEASTEFLAASLMARLPGFPLVLSLTQRDPALEARPKESRRISTLDYITTGRVPVAGSFDDYWAVRGKNLRSNLKKQRARLEREGVALRMDVVRDPAGVAEAVAGYARLEQSGWKALNGTAVGVDNAQGRFYRDMLEAYCGAGRGAIYRYWFGDRLVATDLCIEGGGMLVVLKTAYDDGVPAALSPALLMREEQFRAVFDGGTIAVIEFYGKMMEWHTRWTEDVRTMYHVTAYRWPSLRILKQQAHSARHWLRGMAAARQLKVNE